MYSHFEKFVIKHFVYGMIFGFLYTLLFKDIFGIFLSEMIDVVDNSTLDFIVGFLKSMFIIAVVYTLLAIIFYINSSQRKKLKAIEMKNDINSTVE
ncbi:hypothetical protein [Macrococcus equi]|uniref:hypothetical protein n=1 Tax=Macrococcus equi TaxID=3395462 RepID=UPI0039BE6D5E